MGPSMVYAGSTTKNIQNWKTPREIGACNNVTMTSEGGDLNKPASALFKLK